MKNILVLRFSSFGDIVQCLNALRLLRQQYPEARIDFVTKESFASLVQASGLVNNVFSYSSKKGLFALLNSCLKNSKQFRYDHILDQHSSLRSHLFCFLLSLNFFLKIHFGFKIIRRPKNRLKRFLYFYLRIPTFKFPFIGACSYYPYPTLKSLKSVPYLVFSSNSIPDFSLPIQGEYGILAPFTAWDMKCWPLENFKQIIPHLPFSQWIIVGGPEDRKKAQELAEAFPEKVLNKAGEYSFLETSLLIQNAKFILTGDTGAAHVADIVGTKGLLLIGPSAFGHTVSDRLKVLENKELTCKPCSKDGRGKCRASSYKLCLTSLTVSLVLRELD